MYSVRICGQFCFSLLRVSEIQGRYSDEISPRGDATKRSTVSMYIKKT